MRRHLFATLLTAAVALTAAAKPDEGVRFNGWLDQIWEESLVRDPITATAIGDERYNDKIYDFTTAAWRADNRKFLERQLKELRGFDRSKLAGQDRLSYDILKSDLEEALEGERFPGWMQPLNQFGSMPGFLAQMGSGRSIQPFRSTKDYDDWYKRLSGALPMFDGTIANMRTGMAKGVTQPRPIMEKVLPQIAAHVVDDPEQSIFWGPIKSFPDAVPGRGP